MLVCQEWGFHQILSRDGISENEKILARLGCAFQRNLVPSEELVNTRKEILDAIKNPSTDPLALTIGKIAMNAIPHAITPLGACTILHRAFEAIIEDKWASSVHRYLAIKGRDINIMKKGEEAAFKEKREIMEKIINPSIAQEEMKQFSCRLKISDSPSVISVEDAFVDIDGIKVKINMPC